MHSRNLFLMLTHMLTASTTGATQGVQQMGVAAQPHAQPSADQLYITKALGDAAKTGSLADKVCMAWGQAKTTLLEAKWVARGSWQPQAARRCSALSQHLAWLGYSFTTDCCLSNNFSLQCCATCYMHMQHHARPSFRILASLEMDHF